MQTFTAYMLGGRTEPLNGGQVASDCRGREFSPACGHRDGGRGRRDPPWGSQPGYPLACMAAVWPHGERLCDFIVTTSSSGCLCVTYAQHWGVLRMPVVKVNHCLIRSVTSLEVGQRGKWVMGIEEGTCWDERWESYGSQSDNKLCLKKKKETWHLSQQNLSKCHPQWT